MARRNGQVVEVMASGKRVQRERTPPRKPSEAVYVELPADPSPELFSYTEDDGPQYVDEALQGVLTDLGANDDSAKVTVLRRVAGQGMNREEWLFECHPREFSIPSLQADYGPGEYRVRVKGKQDGSNYKSIIHADKRIIVGALRGAPKAPDAAASAQPRSADELTRAINQAIAAPLMALAQVMKDAMPRQSSRAEMLAEMREFAAMFGAMRPQAEAPDPLGALERAVTLLKDSRAPAIVNEDGEANPNAIIAQGIALVREFVSAAQRQKEAQPQPQPALSAPVETTRPAAMPTQPPQQPPQPSEDADMRIMMAVHLKTLLTAARAGGDPGLYADLILDHAPDEVIAELQGEGWFARLCALEPGFAQQREWSEKVRALVIEGLAEENPPELTPQPAGGITPEDAAPTG